MSFSAGSYGDVLEPRVLSPKPRRNGRVLVREGKGIKGQHRDRFLTSSRRVVVVVVVLMVMMMIMMIYIW